MYETLARLSQLGHYVLCWRTLLELNSLEKYPSLRRVREIRRRLLKLSIKREIRQFTSYPRAVTAKKCTKKRYARAELLFC